MISKLTVSCKVLNLAVTMMMYMTCRQVWHFHCKIVAILNNLIIIG